MTLQELIRFTENEWFNRENDRHRKDTEEQDGEQS